MSRRGRRIRAMLDLAQAMRNEIANLEEQRESLRKRLDRGESFLNKFLSRPIRRT